LKKKKTVTTTTTVVAQITISGRKRKLEELIQYSALDEPLHQQLQQFVTSFFSSNGPHLDHFLGALRPKQFVAASQALEQFLSNLPKLSARLVNHVFLFATSTTGENLLALSGL
jgi:hypothetical protein